MYLHFSESRDKIKKATKKIFLQFYLLCIEPLPTMPHPEQFCIFPGAPLRSHAVDNMQFSHHRIQCTGRSDLSHKQQVGSTKHVTVDCWVLRKQQLAQQLKYSICTQDCSTAIRQTEEGARLNWMYLWFPAHYLTAALWMKQQMGKNRSVLFYSYAKEFVLSASTRIICISSDKIPLILPYLVPVFFNTYISRACIKFLGPPHRLLDAEQALVALGVGHSHLPLQGLGHAFQFIYCVCSVPHNQFALWPQYTINLGKNCRQFASVNKQHRFSIWNTAGKQHRFSCKKHKACKHATCTYQRNLSNSTIHYCFLAELITSVRLNLWVSLVYIPEG